MHAKERVERVLCGLSIDYPLRALWKHFPITDRIPSRFIDRTISFQEQFQWDFVKLMFNGLYSIEDWCPGIRWPSTDWEVGVVEDFAIKSPKDWGSLEPLNPRQGALARELYVTKAIVERYRGIVPVVATLFSPLTTALKMCGDSMFTHMVEDKKLLHQGLEVITQTTLMFVEELKRTGVDGFFFATQLADESRITPSRYEEFGTPYDKQVLEAALKGTWFNIFHLHGMRPMFAEVAKYPVQAINYHDRRCGISLKQARLLTSAMLIGGVNEHGALLEGNKELLIEEFREAIQQLPDGKLMLGPGCVVPLNVPESNFLWLSSFRG